MAVAAAASQHHALSSVLRIPLPPFQSHTRSRVSLPPALPSLSLSHSSPFACFPSTASQPPSLQSLVLLSSLSLFRLPARRITPSLRDYLPSVFAFFYFSFSFFCSPFLCPPTSDGEREKDEENGGGPLSSSEPSFLSPSLQVFSREGR